MNRVVRVFQNSWPGLRSKPIQRYRPAAKKRGGSAAIVIVLSAANHSPYTYHPAYFPNTAEGIRDLAQQNAENYYLSARWDHIDLFQWPISNLQQGETRWSSKESLDWHKLREDLANDFGYKDKYDEGETKHPIPIYVLWNRGYTVRYVQGEYDEDAIKAEWEEKVDLFIESWEIYNDEFEAVRQWRDWANGGWFTPVFSSNPASIYYAEDEEGNPYSGFGSGFRVPTAFPVVTWNWGSDGWPGPWNYYSLTDRNMIDHWEDIYKFIVKKHTIKEESWELDELVWAPPKKCVWDPLQPSSSIGGEPGDWVSYESNEDAWGDEYNCWDIEVDPVDISKVLDYEAYEHDNQWGTYVGDYQAVGINLPSVGSLVGNWHSAIGLSDVTNSASGKAITSNNIVLYIDEPEMPDHVKYSYQYFKEQVINVNEWGEPNDPNSSHKSASILSTTSFYIGGGSFDSGYVGTAHAPLYDPEYNVSVDPNEEKPTQDAYSNFRKHKAASDSVWLDYPSHTTPRVWYRSQEDAQNQLNSGP